MPEKQAEENALGMQLLASLTPDGPVQDIQQNTEKEQVALPSRPSKQGKRKAVDVLLQPSNKTSGPSGSGRSTRRAADPLPQPAKKSIAHGSSVKDGPASKTKGTKQHVAMLSAGKNGLLLEEDLRPAKRLKTEANKGAEDQPGMAHKLWDVLNAVKSHAEDKPSMVSIIRDKPGSH